MTLDMVILPFLGVFQCLLTKIKNVPCRWSTLESGPDLDLWGPWAVQNVGGPPTKVFSLVPITCFESFRALVLLQIGEHSVLKFIKRIRFERKSHILC